MKEKRKRGYLSLQWDEWYDLANRYWMLHDDLLIPNKYATRDGYRLGRWIERQRSLYRRHSHIMTDEKVDKLNSIGMIWVLEERHEWEFWIHLCKVYFEQHGDLEVPISYKTSNDVLLGNWIVQQRKKYRLNLLDETEIRELDAFHMRWEVNERRNWQQWYDVAKRYYQTYGNLDVKVDYIDEYGNRLGMWISVQREKYRHIRKPFLHKEEISLLNELNIKW